MNLYVQIFYFIVFGLSIISFSVFADERTIFKAGHKSLAKWILPKEPPYPDDNVPTDARVALGKMLFFDPRVSRDGNMSCGTCHSPLFGWSDGLPTAKGFQSQVLGRASPTVINTAYNSLQMWDGRKKTLEEQATGPLEADAEMNTDMDAFIAFLNKNKGYQNAFEDAYPGEGITPDTFAKAVASFERTVVSRNSPFDRWVAGDKKAMTKDQIEGFKIFVNPNKGNCEVCHSAPNFTDNGFHNLGLKQFAGTEPDMGRHAIKPIRVLKGAFKTPTLRDVVYTAPYFHDGSAPDLKAVIEHYVRGGEVKTNLSPNMKPLKLSKKETRQLISFIEALASPQEPFILPVLPLR